MRLLIIIFLCLPFCVFAQKKNAKRSLSVFPYTYYQTETSLAFGALLVSFFRTSSKDTISRVSSLSGSFTYTLKNQIVGEVAHTIFTDKEKYLFTGRLTYTKFPLFYFGQGFQSLLTQRVMVDQQNLNWVLRAYRKIDTHLFVGLEYNFNYLFDVFPRHATVFEHNLKASQGIISGFGLLLVRDSRDNLQSARKGSYQEISINSFHRFWASQHSFFSFRADFRYYWQILEKNTLAFQGVVMSTDGDFVPFHRQSLIGGESLMRGYYVGRYRDKDMLVAQIENRLEIGERWGIVVFGAAGGVSDRIINFGYQNIRYTGGLGVRFALNAKNRLKVRLDVGFSKEGFGIYSGLSEIF